nr:immunoglobulin heavy chain junction region [Mus musculus]
CAPITTVGAMDYW